MCTDIGTYGFEMLLVRKPLGGRGARRVLTRRAAAHAAKHVGAEHAARGRRASARPPPSPLALAAALSYSIGGTEGAVWDPPGGGPLQDDVLE